MKVFPILLLVCVVFFNQATSGPIKEQFYGQINSTEDCTKFKQSKDALFARALATDPSNDTAAEWFISGDPPFSVEDCLKLIAGTKKAIIITMPNISIANTFPKGNALLQMKVARGPNAKEDPDSVQITTFAEDSPFLGVVVGFAESEEGNQGEYSKVQIVEIVQQLQAIPETLKKRYIQLSTDLVASSLEETFEPLHSAKISGVIAYQTPQSGLALTKKDVAQKLGLNAANMFLDTNFVPMKIYFEEIVPPVPEVVSTQDTTTPPPKTEAPPETPPPPTQPPLTTVGGAATTYPEALALVVLGLARVFQ